MDVLLYNFIQAHPLIFTALYMLGAFVTAQAVRWMRPTSDGEWMAAIGCIIAWPIAVLLVGIVCVGYLFWKFPIRAMIWAILNANRLTDELVLRLTWRCVSKDDCGELWNGAAPIERIAKVKVQDSAGTYWLDVPPNTKTAREGVAWSYTMGPQGYNPTVRV